ncbi:MAG: hypothetical protein HY721_07125 [Planctomycetes bacterium]|nr:hypothetical protein [Planctomycetota bacterium]
MQLNGRAQAILATVTLVLVLTVFAATDVHAVNKLFVNAQTATVGDTNVAVPVRLNNDQTLYGFSLSMSTDAAKLKITGLDLVGTTISDAGWSFGQILDGGSRISWGVVLDITDPFDLAKVVPAGQNLHIANLRVDVTAAAATSATVGFQDVPGTPPGPSAKNLLVGDQGTSITVTTQNGTITIEEPPPGGFRRGDADNNANLELTDAIRILGYLFLGSLPPTCLEAADSDDNGSVELTDAIRILNYLFTGGAAPAPPGPPPNECGPDPPGSAKFLGCDLYNC